MGVHWSIVCYYILIESGVEKRHSNRPNEYNLCTLIHFQPSISFALPTALQHSFPSIKSTDNMSLDNYSVIWLLIWLWWLVHVWFSHFVSQVTSVIRLFFVWFCCFYAVLYCFVSFHTVERLRLQRRVFITVGFYVYKRVHGCKTRVVVKPHVARNHKKTMKNPQKKKTQRTLKLYRLGDTEMAPIRNFYPRCALRLKKWTYPVKLNLCYFYEMEYR